MSEITVSQEFLRSYGKNLAQYVASLRELFTRNDETDQDITRHLSRLPNYRSVKPILDARKYTDLRPHKAYVPQGMNSTYLAYMEQLETSVGICENLVTDVLDPFERWLGECLSNPDKLKSVSRRGAIDKFAPHDIDGATYKLSGFFDKGSTNVQTTFGSVFDRKADVKDAMAKADELAERFARIDRREVQKRVDAIAVSLETIMDRIEEQDENYVVVEETVEAMSKMSYTVAQEVEFYGVTAYQLTQLLVALSNTVNNMTPR